MYAGAKTNQRSPRKSFPIVEAKRINGKVKQRVIQHVDIATNLSTPFDTHLSLTAGYTTN
jgi:hypothetical protein